MISFSIRGLTLYILFVALTLALTRVEFATGGMILCGAVATANFLVPIRVWRFVTYGGLAGIVVGMIGLIFHLNVVMTSPLARGDGREAVVERMRPFVIQVGALVGGTVGLLRWQRRIKGVTHTIQGPATSERQDTDDQVGGIVLGAVDRRGPELDPAPRGGGS